MAYKVKYEEALKAAETRVYVHMNKGDIEYYFSTYNIVVYGKNGRKKSNPTRGEKEQALIEYLTKEMMDCSAEEIERVQNSYRERFKHDLKIITGGN